MIRISARINAFNEEDHIAGALESLAWADERLVVDSGSTDRTAAIAAGMGARVVQHAFQGYGDKHNFADTQCSYDWIFWLDADERVSPRLRDAIQDWRSREPDCAGYQAARRTWYWDRWINHSGWYPDYQPRLYHRPRTHWDGTPPHEAPKVSGRLGRLDGDLLHFTRRNFHEHIAVLNRYTDLAAQARMQAGERPSLRRLACLPPWAFFQSYILRQGFRDGLPGWLIAMQAGYYVFAKEAKLAEKYFARTPPRT